MGEVLAAAEFNHLQQNERTVSLPDGTRIRARWDGTMNIVEIVLADKPPPEPEVGPYNLWVPRGFVVYPAFHSSPAGYGLPVVPQGSNPYSNVNLAPGTNTARWTAGGPCGEVLLTADTKTGYPVNRLPVPVPLLFQPGLGPVFTWDGQGSFDNRRFESPWTPYRLEQDQTVQRFADENIGNQRALFEGLNALRASSGQSPLSLNPRGYAHPAQIMTSIMLTTGSTDETSAAYPITYRTHADRLTKDGYASVWMNASFPSFTRTDVANAYEFRALASSAAEALALWSADATLHTQLLQNMGTAGFADVGFRGGYWCLNMVVRDRWIEAGNCSWQSSDPDLPAVSWFGFAGVNLAWDTYPAVFNLDDPDHPLTPIYSFTSTFGDCWLNYTRKPAPTTPDLEPGMSRHVFMRGRAIALAPNGGLVWGATIQNDNGVDYLIALIHHPEDQPADFTTNGWTRYLKVWWCILPQRTHLRADPSRTICGTDPTDVYAWKGGQLIDVGHMPPPSSGGTIPPDATSALKMASQWKFSPNGRKAICLRDYGLYMDYSSLFGVIGIQTQTGLSPRAVELTFAISGSGVNTTVLFYDYTTGRNAPFRQIHSVPGTTDPVVGNLYEGPVAPFAVDYDGVGNIIYAFVGWLYPTSSAAFEPTYTYAGIGNFDAKYPTDLKFLALQGARYKTATVDFVPTGIVCTDLRDGVFTCEGVHPRTDINGGAIDAACYPFTESPVHGVRMARRGTQLDLSWYPCPDGVVFSLGSVCDNAIGSTTVFVELPLAMSRTMQSYYANRYGQYVYSYTVAPVPQAVTVLNDAPDDPTCGCRLEIHQILTDSHTLDYSEVAPRGGHTSSQVPLPAADWLIYTKVV